MEDLKGPVDPEGILKGLEKPERLLGPMQRGRRPEVFSIHDKKPSRLLDSS
jgi:hypothetical protein